MVIQRRILDLLNYDGKLLYILKEKGGLRYDELMKVCDPTEKSPKKSKYKLMTRGTMNKYLKSLKSNGYVQTSQAVDSQYTTITKYEITAAGQEFLRQKLSMDQPEDSALLAKTVSPNYFELFYEPITKFFRKINLEETQVLPGLIRMVARIDPNKFMVLPQSNDFYYTFLYIYHNMLEFSLGTDQLLYFGLLPFCEFYNASQSEIEHYVNMLLKLDVGFYAVRWKHSIPISVHENNPNSPNPAQYVEDLLFFQRDDLIGAVVFNLIQNALEEEVVKRSFEDQQPTDFKDHARQITERLISLNLIRSGLRAAFELLIEALCVLRAIARGFTPIDLPNNWQIYRDFGNSSKRADLTNLIFGSGGEYEKLLSLEEIIMKFSPK
jgi:DNA-binding PadR family transcriptional regulator